MGFVVVFLEEIDAEVVSEIAPDCVGVVGVVLGVVVFEEEFGALDAVVVGLAEFGAAGPCEGEGGHAAGMDAVAEDGGEVGAEAADVFAEGFPEEVALSLVEFVGADAGWLEGDGFAFFLADDVVRDLAFEEGGWFLGVGEGFDEETGGVFFFGEDAEAFARSFFDFAGVGAHEGRGDGEDLAAGDGDIAGEVVAFPAPAPCAGIGGIAEEGEVVFFGVPFWGLVFEIEEDPFLAHDGGRFGEALVAEDGVEHGVGEVVLFRAELVEGDAFAVEGDEVPVEAFVVGDFEDGFGFLGVVETGEEVFGGEGHVSDGALVDEVGCGGCAGVEIGVGGNEREGGSEGGRDEEQGGAHGWGEGGGIGDGCTSGIVFHDGGPLTAAISDHETGDPIFRIDALPDDDGGGGACECFVREGGSGVACDGDED